MMTLSSILSENELRLKKLKELYDKLDRDDCFNISIDFDHVMGNILRPCLEREIAFIEYEIRKAKSLLVPIKEHSFFHYLGVSEKED